MQFSMKAPKLTDAAVPASINGMINGAIAWFSFRARPAIPLSMDSIGSPGVTALGNAAIVAFALTFITTCITFLMFRSGARKSATAPAALKSMPFWPAGLGMALLNTLLAFGAFVALAVLWQRFVGTVMVPPQIATLVIMLVAAIATAVAEWRTRREVLSIAAGARFN